MTAAGSVLVHVAGVDARGAVGVGLCLRRSVAAGSRRLGHGGRGVLGAPLASQAVAMTGRHPMQGARDVEVGVRCSRDDGQHGATGRYRLPTPPLVISHCPGLAAGSVLVHVAGVDARGAVGVGQERVRS